MNKNLNNELILLKEKVETLERSRNEEKARADALNTEVVDLRQVNGKMISENETLKVEIQKGVEEMAGALGDGYNRCLGRVSAAGFDATGHHFEDYIRDFAANQVPEVPNQEGGEK